MKKLICLLLLLCVSTACAEGFRYTTTSVTDCQNTDVRFDAFYASGALDAPIPGVAEGIVPQGVAYLPGENWLLFSGYRSDGEPSALIAVDRATQEIVKEVYLQNVDGSAYTGHAGGVCVTDKNLFISNASHLYRISLERFRSLPQAANCAFDEAIPVPVTASYCCYADGIVWVGEFQYGLEYKTDRSHRVKGDDGTYKAWACGYVLEDTEREIGQTPDYILSTDERIQGMTVKDGSIYLSQSYGRRNSSLILKYQNVLQNAPDTTAEVNGTAVPVWSLDKGVKRGSLVAPPMTEGLVTVEDGVIVLFESAAEKYMDPKKPSLNPLDRVFKLTEY